MESSNTDGMGLFSIQANSNTSVFLYFTGLKICCHYKLTVKGFSVDWKTENSNDLCLFFRAKSLSIG